MNLEVGDDDLTADKDYKHVFKRFRNLCLHKAGFTVHGVQIMPSLLHAHLADNGLNTVRINNLLNLHDKHDVKLAYDLLKEIWSLPEIPASTNPRPGFTATRDGSPYNGGSLPTSSHAVYLCGSHFIRTTQTFE